jgi:hypothetical protein
MRSAYSTVTGPAEAGYEVQQKNRRRNRYQTRAHLTLPEPGSQERTAGDVLALLAGTPAGRNGALLDPTDDLGRFPQLRRRWP